MGSHSRIIIVSSDDSQAFFSTNKPSNFVSWLSTRIDTIGTWRIGIKQIIFALKEKPDLNEFTVIDVFLSQAAGSILKCAESNLLQRLIVQMRRSFSIMHAKVDNPDLVLLRQEYLDKLEFDIKIVHSDNFSFDMVKSVEITLLLTKDI
jgi:hypothetical protein